MYNVKNLFTKNPIQISGAIIALVNFLIIVDVMTMTGEAVAGLNLVLTSFLGLFVVQTTTNTAKLQELDNGK